ncbi:unnamed protein product [Trifolium pratense]|uniref:Uncharacterized protein n=1 Tax=Trifolium pratense TaxID=57577 RepID=A0ACB0JB20_TRIPR|nr:unnamed protein product [Trifolium pratense]
MLMISDEGDNDMFFDSLDRLSPPRESLSTIKDFGYEIWLNEPLSVKERKEQFLQVMGLVDDSSKSCEERIIDYSQEESSGCILPSGNEATSDAQVLFDPKDDDDDDKSDATVEGTEHEVRNRESEIPEEFHGTDIGKNKKKKWWKQFVNSGRIAGEIVRSKFSNAGTNKTHRINVRQNKKSWNEFSAVYIGQEIRAHKGLIWTMKFSPNGQYLATGGEDGVVRIWRVSSLKASSIWFAKEDSAVSKLRHDLSFSPKKCSGESPAVLPSKILKIEESPLQELYGHSSDVMDLAWSDSDMLLSSSMDKTVRMWKVGCNRCLKVFHHKDYVTCIHFNPIDENYFISGSIDGKVRVWGVHEERVVDWADIRDVISAISYQPDGKGFVVGSLSGTCRFYVASGKQFELETKIRVNEKKKRSAGNKITGIQFSEKNHQRVMITSRDSKVRILEGGELVQTYKGLPMSGGQMSGSFTSNGKHIISVGEDSRVYIWNFNDSGNYFSKQRKTESSCEYFRSKGVTVAIPWSGMTAETGCTLSDFSDYSSIKKRQYVRESERFSFGSWFSLDGSCRGSMTWPEEKLASWDSPLSEDEFYDEELCLKNLWDDNGVPETWGLSVVAAGLDGTIKTFHNFGFPVRL